MERLNVFIKEDITNETLIEKYGFVKESWFNTYNLKYTDEEGLGLQIWWKDRSIKILLGQHSEFGICPIPPILIRLIQDGVLIFKEGEIDG